MPGAIASSFQNPQSAPVDASGIVVIGKREMMMRIKPAVVGGGPRVLKGRSSIPWRVSLSKVEREIGHEVRADKVL